MNFSLYKTLDGQNDVNRCDLPYSGEKPKVFINIALNNKKFGRLDIELFRNVFPLAVENFVYLCKGSTYHIEDKGFPPYTYKKVVKRTYQNSKIYDYEFNNYIKMGDIYKNNGEGMATIYDDKLIPEYDSEFYYQHSEKGLVSLIPTYDESTGKYYYDGNFLITLDAPNPNNSIAELDTTHHIVIGKVYIGLDVLDRINKLTAPFNARTYPNMTIDSCGFNNIYVPSRRKRPVINNITKYALLTKDNI